MRTLFPLLFLLPSFVLAQPPFPTEFPAGAQSLAPEALKSRLSGKVFVATPFTGAEIRIEYQSEYAYVNVGDYTDSGKWRVEGSSVCISWTKQRLSCTEFRLVDETLYSKRGNNGEIVKLLPR